MDWHDRLLILSAATGPALVLGGILFVLGHRTLPPDVRYLALVAGTFAAIASLAPNLALGLFWRPAAFPGAFEAFVRAALIEETMKFAFLVVMVLRHFEADVRRDAILAGAWIGLGFAVLENASFVVQTDRWLALSIVRAPSAVPFHVALGAIMGWLLQMSGGRRIWWAAVLGVPILLHGSYNWGSFANDDPFPITGLSAEWGLVMFAVTLAVTTALLIGPIAKSLRALNRGRPTPPYVPLPRWAVPLTSIVAAALVPVSAGVVALGLTGWRPLWPHAALLIPAGMMPLAFSILWWRARPRGAPLTAPPAGADRVATP